MSATDAGKIVGGIDWDISSYARGMLQATEIARMFPSIVASFIADPLLGLAEIAMEAFGGVEKAFEIGIDAAKEFASTIREVGLADAEAAETARALGLSVEAFTGLSAAARLAGADTMSFSEGLKFLNRNAADAALGNQDLRREFYQLGVAITDASGNVRDAESVFYDTAEAISRLPNAALQTRFAMDLMGRGAEGMLPFIQRGAAGIRELEEDARRFGAMTTKESSEAGEKFKRLSDDWNLMWDGIKKRASEPVLKEIADNFDPIQQALFHVADAAAAGINTVFAWIGQHKPQIKAFWDDFRSDAGIAFDYLARNAHVWIEDIESVWNAVKDGGKAWAASHSREIKDDLKDIKELAKDAGDFLVDAGRGGAEAGWLIAKGWNAARDALESYTDRLGQWMVKTANENANAALPGLKDLHKLGPVLGDHFKYNGFMGLGIPLSSFSSTVPTAPTAPNSGAPIYQTNVSMQADPSKIAAETARRLEPLIAKAIDDLHKKTNAAAGQIKKRAGL